jgi:HlyD family secretion protein
MASKNFMLARILRRPTVWFVVAILVAMAGVRYVQKRGPLVDVTSAKRMDLEQHLVASGRVRIPTRVQISAQTSGLVLAVGVIEGQRVKAGDLLVQIDDKADRAAVAQAEAAVTQASARVDQLRRVGAIVASESLKQAQTNLARSRSELERVQKLVESAAVPRVELEDAQRAVDLAVAQKNAAQAQQLASAPLGADSRIALSQLVQAQAQLSAVQVRLAHTHIVAMHDGTVLQRSVEPGDVVEPSRTLLVIAADSDVELQFEPDERNLAFIALGQHAKVAADAYPQRLFDAVVSYIAPSIDADRGSIEVRMRGPQPPPILKPDMTVSIDLTVAAKRQALTLAASSVHGVSSSTPWVQVVENGRAKRRDVQLGIRGQGTIEILSGLDERTRVLVPPETPVADGAKVRVR